ncbi:hypothetical protein [Methanosarcina mazei]|jgi:F0F1-type ATP synthase assembly protein I|uniref:Uncharacterized protein n=7 Tax=Methanosarcina mazei TaxID=2209 RepID=A0A6C0VMJ3_METMZ
MINMERPPVKEQLLHFITAVIVCALLGYLSHDLMNGIQTGIFIGIGFVIGMNLIGKRRNQRDQKEIERK